MSVILLYPLFLMFLLQVKHFVFDFLWQPSFMYENKGKFGHWGGIVHSGVHAVATFILLYWAIPSEILSNLALAVICLLEFVIHYIVDWAKMNINAKKGWGPTTHNQFWQLLGVDQLLHQLTYILILVLVLA